VIEASILLPVWYVSDRYQVLADMLKKKPEPWSDASAMVSALESRRMDKLPLWSVYSYDHEDQYSAKLDWYARRLREIRARGPILDIGCGNGELLRWVRPSAGYLGLDVVPGLIEEARTAYPEQTFDCADVRTASLDSFDTVVMIGLLGLSPEPGELIERACALTERYLMFDFLELRSDHRNDNIALHYRSSQGVADDLGRNGLQIMQAPRVGANVRIVARRGDGADV